MKYAFLPYAERCKQEGIRIAEAGDIWENGDNLFLILEIRRDPNQISNGEYVVLDMHTGYKRHIMSEIAERYALSGWRCVG